MKKFNIIVGLVITWLSISSCSDYLDVVPDNIGVIENSFRSRNEAEKYLFTCYSYRPQTGAVDIDPAMASDEVFKRYYVGGFGSVWPSIQIARGFQTANSPILNFWDGENNAKSLWRGIRDCNIFLEQIGDVPNITDYERKRWISEVKFLKAYYHFYLFKCYGPIPIIDVNLPISSEINEVQVYREPVDDVVNYITNLMAEAAIDLPDAAQVIEGTEAGRVDKLIAMSMRAEVLLYAASPLFNGNPDYASLVDNRGIKLFPQSYDETKWTLAADACKAAIAICHAQGKSLYDLVDPIVANADPIFQLQTTYRQAITERWNKELIWGNTNYNNNGLSENAQARIVRLNANNLNRATSEYAPTLKIVEKYYSSNGVPIDEDLDWMDNSWYSNRYKIREEPAQVAEEKYIELDQYTANLHFNREPRFYASIGFDKGIYFGNGYYQFTDTERNVKSANFLKGGVSGFQGGSGYSITGYAAKKMHSFKNAQTNNSISIEYFPFPILRLADLYLMYAEALNEANGPVPEVFEYVDLIRSRAGLNGVKESWLNHSSNPNKPNTKEGLRDIIHQERGIELAFEGKHFWDIRRWKEISDMNDQPKGWNIQGESKEDFYKVVLLPKIPISFSAKDYFWPIKESNLSVNQNLIQNYGW